MKWKTEKADNSFRAKAHAKATQNYRRTVTKFLWFPMRLENTVKWLCYARIIQFLICGDDMPSNLWYWSNRRWEEENEI